MLEAFFKGQTSIAEDLVFPSKGGTVLDQSNLTHYHFLPCLDRAGLRRFRFHDLRQVTVDTYGHLIPGADIAWVDRLDVKTTPQRNATPARLAVRSETEIPPEVVESSGGPAWIRTKNQQIMSLLL